MSLSNKMLRTSQRYRYLVHEFIHRRKLTLPPELCHIHKLTIALQNLSHRWPDAAQRNDDMEYPVFIFSAGWRSGSTLLQRLVISSGEIALWGESLGDAAFSARLGHCLSNISDSWPPDNFFLDGINDFACLSNEWSANLTPHMRFLSIAQRSFFLNWFKLPAQELFGLERWGFKEVRLTIDHARYFKWLFPNSKFIFICRNPLQAFKSWKGNQWGSSWPGYHTSSAVAFSKHWSLLLKGFLSGFREVDGLIIRFEDLISGNVDLKTLAEHIQVNKIEASVLEQKIRSPKHKGRKKRCLTIFDRAIINCFCRTIMKKMNYC
jgi:hypothetical protein